MYSYYYSGMGFSKAGKYLALAERRDCKDHISIFDCNSWHLVKVRQCTLQGKCTVIDPFQCTVCFFLKGGHEKYYWDHSVKCTPKYISQEDEETVRGPGHNAATQQKAATRALQSLRLAIGGGESRIWVFDGIYNQTFTLIRAFTLRGR